ncbi:MAG: serine--tRNA ligase, partial [Thermoplasmata archaeon]
MIDINLLRTNPELVKWSQRKRGEDDSIVDKVLEYDKLWRETIRKINDLRKERNKKSAEVAKLKKEGKLEDLERIRKEMKELNSKIEELEKKEKEYKELRDRLLMSIPNIVHETVPDGLSEEDNVPIRFWGHFKVWEGYLDVFKEQLKGHNVDYEIISWKPKSHVDLLEELDIGDTKRAAKVAGSRFYYLKNELALLDLAIAIFAIEELVKKGYTPVIPPYMLRREAMEGVTDLSAFEEMLYKIEDEDLYLIATAEHSIGAMFMDEILEEKDLPLKFVGFSPCFRKEAGAHGRDTKGIFRVHQFHKVEQFIFSHPEDSWSLHEEITRNAEDLLQKLGIPYRVVNICAGELGAVAAKKYDIEAWMPA